MKLGIDFGTTRIVAAAVDRGNYPLVSFESPDGQTREWFPPLVAMRGNERRFGWSAWAVRGDREWTVLRSLKRLLRGAAPTTRLDFGGRALPLMELATELLTAFHQQLREASTLSAHRGEPIEVMIGVPANANSNQRFLTAEAFRVAGFQVLGMLNEPSAASMEYGHREQAHRKGHPRRSLLVYDLGGGTFDASLVEMEEDTHTVVASAGLPDLGGDDFDEILADLALETAGRAERTRISVRCRVVPAAGGVPRAQGIVESQYAAHRGGPRPRVAMAGARFRSPSGPIMIFAGRWWNVRCPRWRRCSRHIPIGRSRLSM